MGCKRLTPKMEAYWHGEIICERIQFLDIKNMSSRKRLKTRTILAGRPNPIIGYKGANRFWIEE